MKLYIVFGMTGEYSDGREWNVAAYADKTMAQTHVELANTWLRERGLQYSGPKAHDYYYQTDGAKESNPYDPNMMSDYTGTEYNLNEVELRDAVPQVEVKG